MAHHLQCDAGHRWTAESATLPCPVCGSETTVVLTPIAEAPTRTGGPGPATEHPAWAGPPGYTVDGELGRGGMGVVYRAVDPALKRPVALKVLLGGAHAGPAAAARFRAEALAVARLQHQNVVQVYEVGECDGLPFMALEFLPGGSLADRLQAGPLLPAQAVAVVERVANGVQAAHSHGIVHRDLKPANILFDAAGEPKVADFGLAKRLDDEDGATRTGAVLGTPAYMAPEQARGDTKGVGPAADVYALGAVLYACLAGRPPFQGSSVAETMRLVESADAVAPPGPTDLQAVCLKCLEKDPKQRYATAGDLAVDLGRFRSGEAVTARRRPAWVRAIRKAARHKVPIGIGAAAVLTAATVYAVYPPKPAPPVATPVTPVIPEAPPESEVGRTGASQKVRAAALRITSGNNLKQIAIGIHNFDSSYGSIPAPAITDSAGRPLLSWRVTLLPLIEPEYEALYKEFRLNEPWDSAHNKTLIAKMPKVYAMPEAGDPPGHTRYQMITGPGTLGDPAAQRPNPTFGRLGPRMQLIVDGTSQTGLLAEAATPVPWTQPIDLEFQPGKPLPARGGYFESGFNVALADGSVHFTSNRVSEATWRALISYRAGDLLGDDWPLGPAQQQAPSRQK